MRSRRAPSVRVFSWLFVQAWIQFLSASSLMNCSVTVWVTVQRSRRAGRRPRIFNFFLDFFVSKFLPLANETLDHHHGRQLSNTITGLRFSPSLTLILMLYFTAWRKRFSSLKERKDLRSGPYIFIADFVLHVHPMSVLILSEILNLYEQVRGHKQQSLW